MDKNPLSLQWLKAICPICGRGYTYRGDYKPITCSSFLCLQEAHKRGILPLKPHPFITKGVKKMDIPELKTWLKEHIQDEEHNLEMIRESNRKMPIPDIVARRVTETQIMDYRNILRRIESEPE